ncbi:MAG: sigma-54-dependent Fis family transcriptional regulator, partial [Calditrichaeota bacterium]|nr:sigma-54-dependent Fis family transcriptional regulator [Calditrichota bacterium]
MAEILIVDDDTSIRRTLEIYLKSHGHSIHTAESVATARETWQQYKPDLIILDLMLPDGNGINLLSEASENDFGGIVIMITGHQDLDKTMAAMRVGAFDYVHKPINVDELEVSINRALSLQLERERFGLIADLAAERRPGKIVGRSSATVELHKQIGQASRGRANVLIRGESGTGKELVARAIHNNITPNEPLITVNCSAIVLTLLESELFGHEKGAFTDAKETKIGKFELAGEGTVFLDEIGDMDVALQAKILRVIQEKEFQRVGGSTNLKFNARIIAATNRDLESMIKDGSFRDDLYYRLRVIEIYIKPLRERKEDIPDLVDHLLARINNELRRNVNKVSTETMDSLVAYDWRGNVRELENLLMSGVMRSTSDTLQLEIPHNLIQTIDSKPAQSETLTTGNSWERTLADVEKEHISSVLIAVKGHLGRACEVLCITRP